MQKQDAEPCVEYAIFFNNYKCMCGRNTLVFAYSGENETSLERHKNLLTVAIHLCARVWGASVVVQNWVSRGRGMNFTAYLFILLTSEPC